MKQPSPSPSRAERKRRTEGQQKQKEIARLEKIAAYSQYVNKQPTVALGLNDLPVPLYAQNIEHTTPSYANMLLRIELGAARDEAWAGIKKGDFTLLCEHLDRFGPALLKDRRLEGFFEDNWRAAKNSDPAAIQVLEKILSALKAGGGNVRKLNSKTNAQRQQEYRRNIATIREAARGEIERRVESFEKDAKQKKIRVVNWRAVRQRFASEVAAEMSGQTVAQFLRALKPLVTVALQHTALNQMKRIGKSAN